MGAQTRLVAIDLGDEDRDVLGQLEMGPHPLLDLPLEDRSFLPSPKRSNSKLKFTTRT